MVKRTMLSMMKFSDYLKQYQNTKSGFYLPMNNEDNFRKCNESRQYFDVFSNKRLDITKILVRE
jgi:hypothetical protein